MSKGGIDSVVGKRHLFVCWIASLFLLQGLKGSLSADAREKKQLVHASCLVFLFLERKGPKEIHAVLTKTLGEYAPSYGIVKTGWPSSNVVIFFTCNAPRSWWTKTVTNPEIIEHILELILEDFRISDKSITEHLGISVSGLYPSFMKIWTCGNSPPSGSRNAWTRIKNFNVVIRLGIASIFLGAIQVISCRNCWPRKKLSYTTMIRKQRYIQWIGGILSQAAPKNSDFKNPLENFPPRFLGMNNASFSLINFHRARLLTRSITHLCLCNWTFWRKNQWGLVLARQCHGSLVTCIPEETGLPGFPVYLLSTLLSGSSPVGLPSVPWTGKKQLKFVILRPTASMV